MNQLHLIGIPPTKRQLMAYKRRRKKLISFDMMQRELDDRLNYLLAYEPRTSSKSLWQESYCDRPEA